MPRPRKYIDLECEYLAESRVDVQIYCDCGHTAMLPFETFAKFPQSSLYRVVDRLRCLKCRARGEVPEIRVIPRDTGPRRDQARQP